MNPTSTRLEKADRGSEPCERLYTDEQIEKGLNPEQAIRIIAQSGDVDVHTETAHRCLECDTLYDEVSDAIRCDECVDDFTDVSYRFRSASVEKVQVPSDT